MRTAGTIDVADAWPVIPISGTTREREDREIRETSVYRLTRFQGEEAL